MFRIKEHLPDVYVRKSRDFQLLCNIFDIMNMATKFDIDSILNLTSTEFTNENTLPLLQHKLGFFSDINLTGKDLRTILKSFPYLIKNKGTQTGIKQAIQLYLKVIDCDRSTNIRVINSDTTRSELGYNITQPVYVVKVNIKGYVIDTKILTELLKYIIPAGYAVEYHFYEENEAITKIFSKDVVNIVFVKTDDNRAINDCKSDKYSNVNTSTVNNKEGN